MPKRYGYIYSKIYTMDNLKLAHKRAREDKSFYKEVKMIDSNPEYYLSQIQLVLEYKLYFVTQDDYEMFEKNDKGKIRKIFKLDYFPHRIIQWALILQIGDILYKNLIHHTFSSLPSRGIHKTLKELDYVLRNYPDETQDCLQIDVRKFYPNINHEINKSQYRKKFKDEDLLWLIDMLIDSLCLDDERDKINIDTLPVNERKGIAIGSLFSQWDGNFYLSSLDHWLKEEKKVKWYFRYCDDLVILGNKKYLHKLRLDIADYLKNNLKLQMKNNYKVFNVEKQGIDFIGYRHFRNYILLRKSIAKNLINTMRNIQRRIDNGKEFTKTDFGSINSYKGWVKWCSGYNLYMKWIKPLMPYYIQYYNKIIKK